MKLNEIIKWNDKLSFIPNLLNKQKLDQEILTHSVWVEYETDGTPQIELLSLTAIVVRQSLAASVI